MSAAQVPAAALRAGDTILIAAPGKKAGAALARQLTVRSGGHDVLLEAGGRSATLYFADTEVVELVAAGGGPE